MQSKDKSSKIITELAKKYGLEWGEENLAAAIHLKNKHSLDIHRALEQSSHSSDDRGVDAWHYKDGELFIYQSKFSESKSLALGGLSDFKKTLEWMSEVLVDGVVSKVPDNPGLYTLYICLSANKAALKKINFILLSLFNPNELEDRPEVKDILREIQKSRLMKHAVEHGIKFGDNLFEEYNWDSSIPAEAATYQLHKLENSTIYLREKAYLDLAYLSLYSLVELYRRRGDLLFDKNVRLSLNSKDAKDRLMHPMEETFDKICSGELSANIFPFYHVGITISTSSNTIDGDLMSVEEPSIINGCQTITIAAKYYDSLEKKKEALKIEEFKKIKVVAKIVTGTTNEELREITNSNNRQNPIDNWQLFSNEPIHIDIEASLKAIGVFYERQKGKFDSVMKHSDKAREYPNTYNTYLRVTDMGQIIALGKGILQWAAKPSEIFTNPVNHARIFDHNIARYNYDMVFTHNMYLALKRGLSNYLELPAHSDERTAKMFRKPILLAHLRYVGLLYFYQLESKGDLRSELVRRLFQKASPRFVTEAETYFQKIVSRTKTWYFAESNNLTNEVSSKRLWGLAQELAQTVGVDLDDGAKPFSDSGINWSEYIESDQED